MTSFGLYPKLPVVFTMNNTVELREKFVGLLQQVDQDAEEDDHSVGFERIRALEKLPAAEAEMRIKLAKANLPVVKESLLKLLADINAEVFGGKGEVKPWTDRTGYVASDKYFGWINYYGREEAELSLGDLASVSFVINLEDWRSFVFFFGRGRQDVVPHFYGLLNNYSRNPTQRYPQMGFDLADVPDRIVANSRQHILDFLGKVSY